VHARQQTNSTLYVGVTNDLNRRASEHKSKQIRGFTKKHGVDILVWYEIHENIGVAIERESKSRLESCLETPSHRKGKFRLE
jgi:predicted GIY-YIG superfamily endonuclease